MVELQRSGCNVIAVCKPGSHVERFLLARGVECSHPPSYSKVSFESMRYVTSLLNTRRVDVVHVHFHRDIWIPSMVLRNDTQRKLFLSLYMGVFSKNDILHKWIYRRVDAFFTSSQQLNDILPERYPVPAAKIRLLPYGRDLERYRADPLKRESIRRRYNVEDDTLIVGTMVRIDPGKGALDFARSFSYLTPKSQEKIAYMIVGEPTRRGNLKPGEPPFEPHCEAYLREIESLIVQNGHQSKIILAGFQEDVTGYLGAMDVFVFPSRDELYSLVVLDAMAMRLPVIASRAGGNLEQVVDGTNGLLYEAGNSEEMATRIAYYLDHPEMREKHGLAGRSFVETKHDMRATIQQLLDHYHEKK